MDFDPRDHDSRSDNRFEIERGRGSRGASSDHDRDDDWRQPDARVRDQDDHARDRGRGTSSNNRNDDSGDDRHDRDDARWAERDRDPRGLDPRDVFMRDVDLPRGPEREIVHDARDREYTLRGSETRTLSTVGAFRVVSARDLRDHHGGPADPRSGDLRHLREQGLVRTERLDGHRDHVVVLTDRGRDLLNSHRFERPRKAEVVACVSGKHEVRKCQHQPTTHHIDMLERFFGEIVAVLLEALGVEYRILRIDPAGAENGQ